MGSKAMQAFKVLLRQKSFPNFLHDKLHLVSESSGKVCFEMKVDEGHQNCIGTLHGGLSATLVDIVSTMALATTQEEFSYGVSVDLNITFLSVAKVGSTVLVESSVLKAGRRIAFLTVDIKDKDNGKLLVQGRHTKFTG